MHLVTFLCKENNSIVLVWLCNVGEKGFMPTFDLRIYSSWNQNYKTIFTFNVSYSIFSAFCPSLSSNIKMPFFYK